MIITIIIVIVTIHYVCMLSHMSFDFELQKVDHYFTDGHNNWVP